jgi:hypothetical protein
VLRRSLRVGFVLVLLLAAHDARADTYTPPSPDDPVFKKVEAERRAGVVLGGSFGLGFAGASGYPNNVRLIGNPDYYNQTPLMVGTSFSLFVMGAISDYFSLGPMVSWATFDTSQWRSVGFGIGFRFEAFPLVKLLPALADTAIFSQLGVGATEARAKGGDFPSADGTQSYAGIGLHHELRLGRLLGGHAAIGPSVEYDAIFAESAERHWLSVGVRLAWYGGSVKADAR